MTLLYTAAIDANGQPSDGASTAVVPWWSFTKVLIAACTLRLSEQDRIALDQPLSGLPYTPRQLLQHCGGVRDYGPLPEYRAAVARGDEPWSDDELFARVPPGSLHFLPDGGWGYSNVGYLLLRRLLESTCAAGLQEVLGELILGPLELKSSRLAETRDDMRATAFEGGHGYHPGWVFHGVVIGPVVEAALALHRLLHGDLLAPTSRAALLDQYRICGPLAGRPWTETGYGLGLMIGTMTCEDMPRPLRVIGHSAGGPGSVGAVYTSFDTDRYRTAAAFAAGTDEGVTEFEVLRLLTVSERPSA
jgi:CubicO group peptidase (beta-lactamase class C family)